MFASFFFAGFEGSTGRNRDGCWIDQIAATQHDRFVENDYRLLCDAGILAARESVRWPLVDRRGRLDFSSLAPFTRAARTFGIDVLYDLFHFGFPADLDVFSDALIERFSEYCHAAARFIARESANPPTLNPINEPSYFAWAAGEAELFAPHCHRRGPELKLQLARAAIAATDAIWSACPDARIVSIDAMCHTVAPERTPERRAEADDFNVTAVFESWDMLAGRLRPELGGSRAHLGTVGMNYYWTNQWELGLAGIPLAPDDPRRVPLRDLVRTVWQRYGGDILITETGHIGDLRAGWMGELAEEARALLEAGVPLGGVCLYPILGMPEWHDRQQWTRMGLWDIEPDSPTLARVPHVPLLEALKRAQAELVRTKRLARSA